MEARGWGWGSRGGGGGGAVPYKVISERGGALQSNIGKRWRGQKDNIKTQMLYIIYRGVYSVLLTYFGLSSS